MKAKEKHKLNLLKVLGDPEEEFPNRAKYPGILKISKPALYQHFTPEDLIEIEKEAVEIRKARSSKQRANVLRALYSRAMGYEHPEEKAQFADGVWQTHEQTKHYPPDKASAQEFLDRTEGKVPDKHEIGGPGGEPIRPVLNINTGKNNDK